jgi:hypothetical protein
VGFVNGPVSLLTVGAAVLQDYERGAKRMGRYLRQILTTTRRQLAQLDLPAFWHAAPSGPQFAQRSEGAAMVSDVDFGDW